LIHTEEGTVHKIAEDKVEVLCSMSGF